MNRQLTMNGLILATLILATILIFSWMLLQPKTILEMRPVEASSETSRRTFDPYNVPAQ